MRLIEHDGKAILARHGVPVPRSMLIEENEAVRSFEGGCVLKAQTLDGGRGKTGLVVKCAAGQEQAALDAIRARMAAMSLSPLVMAEELVEIEREFYLAIRIDGARQCATLLVGKEGGMEVEQAAPPLQLPIHPHRGLLPHELLPHLREAGFDRKVVAALSRFAAQLYRIFCIEDAELIEINPLVLTAKGRLVAVDCKIEVDDSAIIRHHDHGRLRSATLPNPAQTELERRAAEMHLSFVEMKGNVAVLTAGAGLGMAVVDALHDVGLSAANFIDAYAGMSLESKIDFVFERAKDPQVEAIAIFFLQTANPLRRTMSRLLEMLDQAPPPKPLAIAVVAAAGGERGMTRLEAVEELNRRGYQTAETFEELAASVKRIVTEARRECA